MYKIKTKTIDASTLTDEDVIYNETLKEINKDLRKQKEEKNVLIESLRKENEEMQNKIRTFESVIYFADNELKIVDLVKQSENLSLENEQLKQEVLEKRDILKMMQEHCMKCRPNKNSKKKKTDEKVTDKIMTEQEKTDVIIDNDDRDTMETDDSLLYTLVKNKQSGFQ